MATDPFLKTSFDTLLKLQEVICCRTLAAALAYDWIETPSSEGQVEICYDTVG
jgi:hypothetical protein